MDRNKHLVVISGAGMSAESGISTFRDADGLWEGHDIMEVASPQGWNKNKALVLDFYNQRRRQLKKVKPNKGHLALAEAQDWLTVTIVTQNVDDLHERAGSNRIIHLHGELTKARSEFAPELIYDWTEDINLGDKAEDGRQLRPHIVWFGEQIPEFESAQMEVSEADYVIIVGTSLMVYPAAMLYQYAPHHARIYYIDPNPGPIDNAFKNRVRIIQSPATKGIPLALQDIRENDNV